MTLNDGFDRTVSVWLDEQAGRGAPGYLDEILTRTTRTRQRPAWSSLERWLPVQTTLRLAPVPRIAWLLVVLALIVALGVAVLAVGSRRNLPAPFGLARNGALVYGAADGDIYALDPVTGKSTAIIAGPTIDASPTYSRDGSRLAFLRGRATADNSGQTLMVANADGSDVRALTEPLVNFGWFKWSPDGSRLALVDHETVRILDVDGTTAPTVLNIPAERMWWRPDGREVVFQDPRGLYAIRVDGTGLRTIVANANITGAGAPALSPDGTEIAYTTAFSGGVVIHIVNVDTGQDRTPLFDGTTGVDGWANWSPDGTRLVFQRLIANCAAPCSTQFVVGLATGGPVVETGPTMPPGSDNDIFYEFSPDGSKIIARFGPDSSTWILEASGGPGERLSAADGPPTNTGNDFASWQRLAR